MKVRIAAEYEPQRSFIESIPDRFETEGRTIDCRRNVLKVFQSPEGESWVVKRYRRPVLFQRFVYTFIRKPKSDRAFLYARRLLGLGISTPVAVASVDVYRGGLFDYGYFICRESADPCVFDILTKTEVFDRDLAAAAAAYMAKIHETGVLHGDLNLTNIMYRRGDEGWEFSIIDTNRCTFSESLSRKQCLRELRRVSHRKDLFDFLIWQYALARGWQPAETLEQTQKYLADFERWEAFKRWWKNKK